MRHFLLLLLTSLTVQLSVAPPVNQKHKDGEQDTDVETEDVNDMSDILEYQRYLTEVLELLESDPEFREKLHNVDVGDIRTGKIADELQFVQHNVRSRLDEIKRRELERLRRLATKENELKNRLDIEHLKVPEHVDHTNTRTFEIHDLRKLIAKTTKDLLNIDKKRREEFKQREMQRQYDEQEMLKRMNDAERKKFEENLAALKEEHKKHEPLHHPGSKQQLEEVWEKYDHMENEEFNPRTFFFFHDIDGNGVWDQDEVKTLFLKELDKLYARGASEKDLIRRAEEMERMREHVFNEADLNKDGLISYHEFLEQTRKPDFERDEGWVGLDEQQLYTQEEFEAFERHKQEELQKMIAKGMLPPHPGSVAAQAESFPPQYGHAAPAAAGVNSNQGNQVNPLPQMSVQQNQPHNSHGPPDLQTVPHPVQQEIIRNHIPVDGKV